MRKPFHKLAAAFLTCSILLAGCAVKDDSRSVLMAAPAVSVAPPSHPAATSEPFIPDEDIPLHTVAANISSTYAGTENGCYSISNSPDGLATLAWFDYAARTVTPLDITPFTNQYGGSTVLFLNGMLYVIHHGGTDALQQTYGAGGVASITQFNPATGSRTVATLPQGLTFKANSAVLTDDMALYFMVEESSEEGPQSILYRLDCENMHVGEMHRFSPELDYTINGYWTRGVLLCGASPLPAIDDPNFAASWSARSFTLFTVGMNSGTETPIFAWQQGLPTVSYNNMFYYFDEAGGTLQALNADTSAFTVVASDFAPEDYEQAQFLRTVVGGKLQMQFSYYRGMLHYVIDPTNGEVVEIPRKTADDNITVLAENNEYFLVQNDTRWVNRELVEPDFDAASVSSYNDKFVSVPVYSLILKADYWAAKNNFIPIEDLLYE